MPDYFICDCGVTIHHSSYIYHKKSDKHLKLLILKEEIEMLKKENELLKDELNKAIKNLVDTMKG